MKELIKNIILDEIKKMDLKEKMTGFLVKKKKRGTYQALTECSDIESEIINETITYIDAWLINELLDGFLKEKLQAEIENQVILELSRRGFIGILQ